MGDGRWAMGDVMAGADELAVITVLQDIAFG